MEIEEVAAKTRRRSSRSRSTRRSGLQPYQARRLAYAARLPGRARSARPPTIMLALARVFLDKDCIARRDQPAGHDRRTGELRRARRQDRPSTTTPSSATRRSRRCATSREENPPRSRRQDGEPHLHQARRQHRLPRQRRRPGDGDDGHHQARTAASRRTSSTSAAAPRRSRSTEAFRIILARPEREGHPRQHLRRHRQVRRDRRGRRRGGARDVGLKVPLVVRLEGTNVEAGRGRSSQKQRARRSIDRDGPDRRGEEGRRRGWRSPMSILVDRNTRVVVQGITGAAGTFTRRPDGRVRHAGRRRRDARARAARPWTASPSSTRWPRPSRRPGANAHDDLRSAARVRGRRHPRGGRRGDPGHRRHHRGHARCSTWPA